MNMDTLLDIGSVDRAKKFIKKLYSIHPEFFNINYKDIKKEKKIGSGAFGIVYKGTYNKETVAIKHVFLETDHAYKYLYREIENLRIVNHPNVIKYYGLCHNNFENIYLITDFVDGGSLLSRYKKIRGNYELILDILIYLAQALTYMELIKMLHRDLKLANILVNKNKTVLKLCDFGLARLGTKKEDRSYCLERKLTIVGTKKYMAPELTTGHRSAVAPPSSAIDIYSYGIIVAELLGYPVTCGGQFDFKKFEKKRDKKGPAEFLTLAFACTDALPEKRPTFAAILANLNHLRTLWYPQKSPIVHIIPEQPEIVATKTTTPSRMRRKLKRSISADHLGTCDEEIVTRDRGICVLERPQTLVTTPM